MRSKIAAVILASAAIATATSAQDLANMAVPEFAPAPAQPAPAAAETPAPAVVEAPRQKERQAREKKDKAAAAKKAPAAKR